MRIANGSFGSIWMLVVSNEPVFVELGNLIINFVIDIKTTVTAEENRNNDVPKAAPGGGDLFGAMSESQGFLELKYCQ